MRNPLADNAAFDAEDRELVRQAQGGNREALEQLITRHQAWIYNIAHSTHRDQAVHAIVITGTTAS
jgi:hypothetical protein